MATNTYTPDSTKVVHTTSVDFIRRYINAPIHIVQYDNRLSIIAVDLYSNGSVYAVPSGFTVNIRTKKSDGNFIYNSALGCNAARTKVYFEVTAQMCAVSGDEYPVVEIKNGDEIAASGYFYMIVDPNPVLDSSIESASEGKAMQAYVTEARSWARGDTGTRTDENVNNAMYYSNLSSSQAAAAKVAADAAKNSENKASTYASNASTSANAAYGHSVTASSKALTAAEKATAAENSASAANSSKIDAEASATNAASSATGAAYSSRLAESWAIGGTGVREDEDNNNAKYWSDRAQAVAKVDIATTEIAGIVKPDGETITVENDGTIHAAGQGDDVTIVKNEEGLLSVPIDNETIYIQNGKMKAAGGGGGGSSNIEDIDIDTYEAKKEAEELDRGKYYAIRGDLKDAIKGDGVIPITREQYDRLSEEHPEYKIGKTYAVYDTQEILYNDYEDNEYKVAGVEVPEHANADRFGTVKISGATDVTTDDGLVLSAKEKNASEEGTLAHDINDINARIGDTALPEGDATITGAIDSLNNTLSGITENYKLWTPQNVVASNSARCFYQKNGKILSIHFQITINLKKGSDSGQGEAKQICTDFANTFGVTPTRDSFAPCVSNDASIRNATGDVMVWEAGNIIYIQNNKNVDLNNVTYWGTLSVPI